MAAEKIRWAGIILTGLCAALMLASGTMKLIRPAELTEQFVGHLGYPESTILGIALVEITCAVLFLIPRTSVLGAVLLTGYLGGAIATHVRVGDNFLAPLALGVLIWGGIYLREGRLHSLLPLRGPRAD